MAGFEFALMLPSSCLFSIDGDTASGHWYLQGTHPGQGGTGRQQHQPLPDTYSKRNGQWLYQSRHYGIIYRRPGPQRQLRRRHSAPAPAASCAVFSPVRGCGSPACRHCCHRTGAGRWAGYCRAIDDFLPVLQLASCSHRTSSTDALAKTVG